MNLVYLVYITNRKGGATEGTNRMGVIDGHQFHGYITFRLLIYRKAIFEVI